MPTKKALLLFLLLGVFVFAGCLKKSNNNQQSQQQNNNQNQQQVVDPNNQNQQQANNENQQQDDGQRDQVADPYEGWQTYRNEDLGFEIKYPDSFYVRDCSYLIGFSKENKDITECGEGHKTLTPINIIATIYDIGDGPNELLQKKINFYDEALDQKTERSLSLNGIQATELSGIWKSRDNILRKDIIGTKTKIILFVKDDYVFSVALDYYNLDGDAVSDYESVFDDIISTFKFQE